MASLSVRPSSTSPARLSLVAAASRRKLDNGQINLEIRQEGWQSRMWNFYDQLGAVHYGISFKRNAAAKVAYFAAEKDENDPDLDPQPTTNQAVIDAVARLRSSYGGLKEIIGELMVHINVPGEGYLVGKNGLEGEEWDVWSVAEVQQSQFGASWILNPDRAFLEDEGVFAARIWRPHPQDRSRADAPLRPVSEQCEQLLLLEDSISAAAKSRLSAGLFYVPSELDIGDQTGFEDDLIAILTTPIKDTESAARWSPGLLRGPAEYFSSIGHINFSREIDANFAAMREELTRAIAAGLDLPAEIILGKADLNHWTGWDIDESAFRDHVDPDIVLIMDSITRGYLHPALIEEGIDPERYLIWRDLSDLGQKPPSIPEAIELNLAGIISDEYVRNLIGAGEEDAPDEPPEPAIVEVPMINQPVPPNPENAQTAPPPMPAVAAAVELRPLVELGRIDRLVLEKISEAAEGAFNRVLERAGAKIRSHAQKDRTISASISHTPNDQVTRLLGERLVAQLQITPNELVPADSFSGLEKRVRKILTNAAEETANRLEQLTGERPPIDDRKLGAAVAAFLAALSAFALRLLFRTPAPEQGEIGDTVIPAGLIVDMMTQAGGGGTITGPSAARGFAAGADSINWLSLHGVRVAGHRWEYGDPSTRQQRFDPHYRLDGEEFDRWDDEKLLTPASASWLSVLHMFPGDHGGCRCMTVPVVAADRRAA